MLLIRTDSDFDQYNNPQQIARLLYQKGLKTNSMKTLLKKLNDHKGEFNVSIILPTEREFFDKDVNQKRVKAAIKMAGEKIRDLKPDYHFLIQKMIYLSGEIEWKHSMNGVGIFASPAIAEWIPFSNPVKEKIIVDESFETRDIIYQIQNENKFWLLLLSLNRTRLLYYHGHNSTEINDILFPSKYIEEFDLEKTPSRIRSTHGVEDSVAHQVREKNFIHQADTNLSKYLKQDKAPLIIAGDEKDLAIFNEITKHKSNVIAALHGNFDHIALDKTILQAVEAFVEVGNKLRKSMVTELSEYIGYNKCVWGLMDVWKAVTEGRCDTLFVEKDYMVPAFFNAELFKTNPEGKPRYASPFISDIINIIINEVYEKKGKIVFADNGEMLEFNKIASILRYKI